jgi:hypothetical protein
LKVFPVNYRKYILKIVLKQLIATSFSKRAIIAIIYSN